MSERKAQAAHHARHKEIETQNYNGPAFFERFAHRTAIMVGRPYAFVIAVLVVPIWVVTGPLFDYSDTWQLAINTGTTIVTFLMVFLIQQSQNRDTMAAQIKLAELIIAMKGAKNRLATAEDLSEHELRALHESYCELAAKTLEHLKERHAKTAK